VLHISLWISYIGLTLLVFGYYALIIGFGDESLGVGEVITLVGLPVVLLWQILTGLFAIERLVTSNKMLVFIVFYYFQSLRWCPICPYLLWQFLYCHSEYISLCTMQKDTMKNTPLTPQPNRAFLFYLP